MRRLLRAPLLHFVAGGAVLFAVVHGGERSVAVVPAAIVVSAADVDAFRRSYVRETGLEMSAADEAGMVERAIDEELLFREALARGLDGDRSIRNWLVEQMRVLEPDAPDDAASRWTRAQELGLDRTDLVVRRMLVQKMRLLAAREHEVPPSDDVLGAYYAEHAADYALPERVTLWHVFLGEAAPPDAERLLAELRRDRVTPVTAIRRGQTFDAPPKLDAQSAADLSSRFGREAAAAMAAAPAGVWSGPFVSPWGVHLVFVEARTSPALPNLAAVRGRLRERWLDEQRKRRLRETLQVLRTRHPLQVESVAWREQEAAEQRAATTGDGPRCDEVSCSEARS